MPVVSFALCYSAGAVDESFGETGAAHLLEHMLFKGTPSIGTKDFDAEKPLIRQIHDVGIMLDKLEREGATDNNSRVVSLRRKLSALQEQHNRLLNANELDAVYARHGAEGFNASTGFDITTYTVSLPANRVELWARIESERFAQPVFRQYFIERNIVLEELRQNYESRPERLLLSHILSTAFFAHPYGRPIIGWPSDIKYLSPDACERFFKTHYTPNRAVAAIVGDVNPDSVYAIVRRYFGKHPAAHATDIRAITIEPGQKGERRVIVEADAEPLLIVAYHKPTLPHPDDTVFDVIDALLTAGRSSRLYKRLVTELRIASQVETMNGFPGARYPNLFLIKIAPHRSISYTKVEQALYHELNRLWNEAIPPHELETAKKQIRSDLMRRMQSNDELADLLSYYQTIAGDWRYIDKNLERIENVTTINIQAVAKRYFTASNRTVGMLKNKNDHD
ncbi:MAG: insulinase family protein [Desulfobacterota bacterium]|nr:insulinase family protein [Thermodesulfobacteriota bacterium]